MMTTNIFGRARCSVCRKENAVLKCEGCLETFCYKHVNDHRQKLNKQLDDVAVTCDMMREALNEQTTDSQKHPLIQQIDQWEQQSIEQIRRTAEEARQMIVKHTIGPVAEIEVKLRKVTNEIRHGREENDFSEADLSHWRSSLTKLKDKLPLQSSNITLREDSTPFIKKLYVDLSGKEFFSLVPQLSVIGNSNKDAKWLPDGITVAGGNGSGHDVSQLYNPVSVCVDDEDDQTIYIADYWNNRIMKWKADATKGEVAVNGTIQINRTDQINCPRDVIIDKKTDSLIICDIGHRQVVQCFRQNGMKPKPIVSDIDCWGLAMDAYGYLYVSDYNRHEVRRWKLGESKSVVVAGGNGAGAHFDQLQNPTSIFVDDEQSIYVSDRYNHRVVKWKAGVKQGVIVAGNQIEGNSLKQLSDPTGIVVDQWKTVYVADSNNHRVMRWTKDAHEGSVAIGGHGHGNHSNQLYNPWGISLDQQGNLYVADNANHRIQRFDLDTTVQ